MLSWAFHTKRLLGAIFHESRVQSLIPAPKLQSPDGAAARLVIEPDLAISNNPLQPPSHSILPSADLSPFNHVCCFQGSTVKQSCRTLLRLVRALGQHNDQARRRWPQGGRQALDPDDPDPSDREPLPPSVSDLTAASSAAEYSRCLGRLETALTTSTTMLVSVPFFTAPSVSALSSSHLHPIVVHIRSASSASPLLSPMTVHSIKVENQMRSASAAPPVGLQSSSPTLSLPPCLSRTWSTHSGYGARTRTKDASTSASGISFGDMSGVTAHTSTLIRISTRASAVDAPPRSCEKIGPHTVSSARSERHLAPLVTSYSAQTSLRRIVDLARRSQRSASIAALKRSRLGWQFISTTSVQTHPLSARTHLLAVLGMGPVAVSSAQQRQLQRAPITPIWKTSAALNRSKHSSPFSTTTSPSSETKIWPSRLE